MKKKDKDKNDVFQGEESLEAHGLPVEKIEKALHFASVFADFSKS